MSMLKITGFKVAEKKCSVCGGKFTAMEMVAVKKFGCVCNSCISKVEDYSQQNGKLVGKGNKRNRSISFEFETSEKNADCVLLRKYGFIPSHDGSIGGYEWKSPIYKGMQGVKKVLTSMDDLARYVGSDCGTHIHVGTLTDSDKRVIADNENVIFGKLVEYMKRHTAETIDFWGRDFTGYATSEFGEGRYQAFSVHTNRKPTIEYRLPKFKNAEQFYKIMQLCVELTDKIMVYVQKAKPHTEARNYGLAEKVMSELSEILLDTYMKYLSA